MDILVVQDWPGKFRIELFFTFRPRQYNPSQHYTSLKRCTIDVSVFKFCPSQFWKVCHIFRQRFFNLAEPSMCSSSLICDVGHLSRLPFSFVSKRPWFSVSRIRSLLLDCCSTFLVLFYSGTGYLMWSVSGVELMICGHTQFVNCTFRVDCDA